MAEAKIEVIYPPPPTDIEIFDWSGLFQCAPAALWLTGANWPLGKREERQRFLSLSPL